MDMPSTLQGTGGNRLLVSFSPECRDFLEERMMTKPIISGEVLYEAETPLLNLIFPHEGIVSLQSILQDGRAVERMTVGSEGFVGVEFVLGSNRIASHVVAVVSGRATWVPVSAMSAAVEKFPEVRPLVHAFVVNKFRRTMQAVVCASVHNASQRIASWLLHADDRSVNSQFDITQKMLASIFGLRLATVSDACARLHAAGAIHHSRGSMSIVDRASLEAQACECYETLCQPQDI